MSESISPSMIPGPVILPRSGYWMAQINEFAITAGSRKVYVLYTGVFNNTFHAKGTVFVLPLPQASENIEFLSQGLSWHMASVQMPKHAVFPSVDLALVPALNTVRVSFQLPASLVGLVQWRSPVDHDLESILPGVSLFMWSGLKETSMPKDFSSMKLNTNPQASAVISPVQEWGRLGTSSSPYPTMQWSGVLPHRGLGVSVIVCLGLLAFWKLYRLWKKTVTKQV